MYAKKEENKVKIYGKLPEVYEKENGQTKPNFRSASQEVFTMLKTLFIILKIKS